MSLKSNIFIITLLFVFSCSVDKQEDANKIINDFYAENNPDKRETIFEVQTISQKGRLILTGETDLPELKNKLLYSLQQFKIEDKITILPDSTVGDKEFGLINLSVANLRSEPNHSAELATQALMGTPVKILKVSKGWVLLQTPDKYISWIDSDGVFPITGSQHEKWKNSNRMIFTGDNGTIYENETFENPVSDVVLGNISETIETNSKCVKVMLPDGRMGFSESSYWIDFNDFKNSVHADSVQLKNLATSFSGRPYLWGGTSARAMDCSGFVKTLYFMSGIILARDASLQYKNGQIIDAKNDFSNFQTGDLIFFGQKQTDSQPQKVTHVALSLGNTEFIHASGRIERNSFNPESKIYSEYRKNSFIGAKRVIGCENKNGILTIQNHPWY